MRKTVFLTGILLGCSAVPDVQVVDGDTISIDGESMRLMGFDTPEAYRPKCPSERDLADKATQHLAFLINTADRTKIIYARNDQGEVRRDRYGRLLGRLLVDGVDVAEHQIGAGLALAYDGGRRQSWCKGETP